MARVPRKLVVDLTEVGVYHCINRCVRRAFLCGSDPQSGRSFEHRRQWIQDKLRYLAGLFSVEIMAFAVMSNHLHLVLRNRPDLVTGMTDLEVAWRWWGICPLRREADGSPSEPEDHELQMLIADESKRAELRKRLANPSWLMRCLAEPIARRANREDECTGRFWEGRFKCIPLLDEAAIAACMLYVDLNPIRACQAETPEESRFTSAFERIKGRLALEKIINSQSATEPAINVGDVPWLSPIELTEEPPRVAPDAFIASAAETLRTTDASSPVKNVAKSERPMLPSRTSDKGCLPMRLDDYLELLDWTGRQFRLDKPGQTPANLSPILDRLGVSPDGLFHLVRDFSRLFRRAAGRPQKLQQEASRRGQRWMQTRADKSHFV